MDDSDDKTVLASSSVTPASQSQDYVGPSQPKRPTAPRRTTTRYMRATEVIKEPTWARFFPGAYDEKRIFNLQGESMKWAIQLIAGLAILFYGFDQGVMSGVNETPDYLRLMGTDSQQRTGTESSRDSAAIGGIVAIYYLGTLFGGLIGGVLGDEIGRIKTILFACVWATFGAALQSSAQNITWMMFARLITGVGTGQLNAIVPVWSAEVSTHDGRGAALGFEFFLNIGGLSIAYWIEFALFKSNVKESIQWRLPLAIQIIFLVILMAVMPFFPESPRWLAKVGREDEARRLLTRLRGTDLDIDDEDIVSEMNDIMLVVDLERKTAKKNSYWHMLTKKDSYNLRRRVWLVIWLQIMQELVGIGVVTVYAPTVFRQAGYSDNKARLLSGINDLTYMLSVLVAVFTLDRVGRRVTMYYGAVVMGVALLLTGAAAKYALQYGAKGDTAEANKWGAVVTTFTFVYTAGFGSTWLTVPWLYPTEVFPLTVRAKGGAFSVVGWSIGNGIITEITPFLFKSITYWTFILFGVLNFLTLPFIWAWYPETAGRSLEEMDILFATDHLRVWKGEQVLAKIAAENPELYEAAKKGDIAALHASVAYAKGATEDIKDVDASGRPLSIKDETANVKA